MVCGIAHDFNNLIGIIRESVALCRSGEIPAHDIQEQMTVIAQATHQASNLIRKLQVCAGSVAMTFQPLDLKQLILDIQPLLRAAVPQRIDFKIEAADDLPLVEADRTQLVQVLANLVINASESIAERSGTIRIAISPFDENDDRNAIPIARIGQPVATTCVRVTVSDTGTGIPADRLKQIFDPYFTTRGAGRGLGLSSVAAIMTAHGGALQAESEPGRGAAFSLLLPTVTSARKPAEASPGQAPADADNAANVALCILLVEDDPRVRRVTQQLLETLGSQVLTASDEQDVAGLSGQDFDGIDGVILDANLSSMDGIRTLQTIRRLCRSKPVFLFSGHDEFQVRTAFAGHSFDGFLAKPFTRADLATLLQKIPGRTLAAE